MINDSEVKHSDFAQAYANEIARLTRETAKIVRNANAEFYRNCEI